MMLLTKENRRVLPKIGAQESLGDQAVAYVKFFDPSGRLTYYITEFDGEDTLFGFMVSPLGADCDEWGYSSLNELEHVKGRFGLGIERDYHFRPTAVHNIVGPGR